MIYLKNKCSISKLLILVCITLQFNIIVFSQNQYRPASITNSKTYGKGELRWIEGVPFLKLRGTYYEMGEQYGTLLRDEIQKIAKDLEPFKNEVQPKIPKFYYLKMGKVLPARYIEQLKGLASGSGIPYKDLLLGAFLDLIKYPGCSSILLKINTENGNYKLLHGRNQDYDLGKYPVVIEYQPDSYHKYIIAGVIGSISISEGMNEEGITVSINTGNGGWKNHRIKNMHNNCQIRTILEETSSLHEVDSMMNNYSTDKGAISIIGSGSEKSGVIYDIAYNKQQKNFFNNSNQLFVTNDFLNPHLTKPSVLLKCNRFKTIDSLTRYNQITTIDGLINLLSTFPVNNDLTIHSVVFDPQEKIIYMAFSEHVSAWHQWLKYDWRNDTVTIYKESQKEKLELNELHIDGAYWNSDTTRAICWDHYQGSDFILSISDWLEGIDYHQLSDFADRTTQEVILRAEGLPDVKAKISHAFTTYSNSQKKFHGIWFKLDDENLSKMLKNVAYSIYFINKNDYKWIVNEGVNLTRQ